MVINKRDVRSRRLRQTIHIINSRANLHRCCESRECLTCSGEDQMSTTLDRRTWRAILGTYLEIY